MPIEPVKIPQNVYVEERIIGPVTLRQIIITMIGGGFSYALWSSIKAAGAISLLSTILAWIPAVIAAAFAFVRINDISLFRLCILLMERFEKPSIRTWSPRRGITINISVSAPRRKKKKKEEPKAEEEAAPGIEELTTILDTVERKSTFSKLFKWFGGEDSAAKAAQRRRKFTKKGAKLRDRLQIVESGLNNVGLMTHRLTTHELIELYYRVYNPKTSMEEKLPSLYDLKMEKMVL